MADNYLERKFEEYRQRKSTTKARHTASAPGAKPGCLQVPFTVRRVFVAMPLGDIGETIISAFRKAGYRVAFCDIDRKTGQSFAESSGSRFYPVESCDGISDLIGRISDDYSGIDIIICNTDDLADISEKFQTIRTSQDAPNSYGRIIAIGNTDSESIKATALKMLESGMTVNAISPDGIAASDIARLCLFICMDANSFIDGINLSFPRLK